MTGTKLKNERIILARAVDRSRGCLLGLAIGDAIGTTVEFKPRDTFEPVVDMIGGGAFKLKPGEWTDDTSMALCLAQSLIDCNGFSPKDQMKKYLAWRDEGYMSSNGRCFDIGITVSGALSRYKQNGDHWAGSTQANTAGNGSIMRLAPVPIFYWRDVDYALSMSWISSKTTHRAEECLHASAALGALLALAIQGVEKEHILAATMAALAKKEICASIRAVIQGEFNHAPRSAIRGTGYVVESLKAALWCVFNTESYHEAVLMAANLGDDADTTAAIAGQIAGALYGEKTIPKYWRDKVVMGREIGAMAEHLSLGT